LMKPEGEKGDSDELIPGRQKGCGRRKTTLAVRGKGRNVFHPLIAFTEKKGESIKCSLLV